MKQIYKKLFKSQNNGNKLLIITNQTKIILKIIIKQIINYIQKENTKKVNTIKFRCQIKNKQDKRIKSKKKMKLLKLIKNYN